MAPGYPIKINNEWIKTAEALYQALKYPHNPEIQKKIIFANSPIVAKRISVLENVAKEIVACHPDHSFIDRLLSFVARVFF